MFEPTIAAVMIHVTSVAEALDWYERAFPGSIRSSVASPRFEFLVIGGVRIEIVPADEKVASGASGSIVYWQVPQLEAALDHMEKIGARLYRGPLSIEDGQAMCQVQDPWGNCIGLRGPSADGRASQKDDIASLAGMASVPCEDSPRNLRGPSGEIDLGWLGESGVQVGGRE